MIFEKLIVIILLLVSYVLQFSIDFFVLGNINPDFLLILTAYFALHRGEISGLWVGFFAGLLQDINLGGYFSPVFSQAKYYVGTYALPKALLGYTAGKFSPYFIKESNVMIFLLLLSLSIMKGIMVFVIVVIFHQGIDARVLLLVVLPEAIYTGIISIFWFKALKIVFPIYQKSDKTITLGKNT